MKSKNLTYLMTHPLVFLWFIILGAVMMFLLGRQSHTWYNISMGTATTIQKPEHAIGEYVQLQGVVDGFYGFGMLKLNDNQGNRWVLKSTTTNITHLTGQISIQGAIVEYNGTMPVVNVYQYQAQGVDAGLQFWYDVDNRIALRPGYDMSVVVSGDVVLLTDPVVHKEVIKIRSFECVGTGTQGDCSIENNKTLPSFISSYRHKFIKKDNLWFVFGSGMGYRIRVSDEYYVNELSQYFDLMNDRLMADLVRKELKTKCVGPQTDVVEYISHKTREQNGNTFAIVRGLSHKHKLAICQLKLITTDHMLGFEGITTIPVE